MPEMLAIAEFQVGENFSWGATVITASPPSPLFRLPGCPFTDDRLLLLLVLRPKQARLLTIIHSGRQPYD